MNLYLDTCGLMRPFDDPADPRVAAEAATVRAILGSVETGLHALIVSHVHRAENARNPHPERRRFLLRVLAHAAGFVELSDGVRVQAAVWRSRGLGVFDARHMAAAEEARVDVFATCDDNLLRRAARWPTAVRCLSLLDLAQELGL